MSRPIRLILTFGLAAMLAIGLLGLAVSQFLQATVLSLDYFERSIVSPTYVTKVHEAIVEDFGGQSSYVGVPVEVLTAGLDDTLLKSLIVDHLANLSDVLHLRAEYQPVRYPSDAFYASLEAYIIEYTGKSGTEPTAGQLDQLQVVSADAAVIVASHINLFDLDLVNGSSTFTKVLSILNRVAGWGALSLLIITLSLGGIFAVNGRHWRRGLFSSLLTVWLISSLVLIPALVLSWFGLPRRLSLGTGYLKLAVDNWLTGANNYLLTIGIIAFLISSIYLLSHFLINENRLRRLSKLR